MRIRIAATIAVRMLAVLWILALAACRDTGRVDATTLERTASGMRLHVTIVGAKADPRIAPVREALGYWNRELARLGRHVQLDSGTIRELQIPDEVLRDASSEARFGIGPAIWRLRSRLSVMPGDIFVVLSGADLISYGLTWTSRSRGAVVIRRSDIWPLSMPNTTRNVVAHELGHVLGLEHNADASTLMCGRPAPCRPAAFASDRAHFFPLSAADDAVIRARWP